MRTPAPRAVGPSGEDTPLNLSQPIGVFTSPFFAFFIVDAGHIFALEAIPNCPGDQPYGASGPYETLPGTLIH